MEHQEGHLPAMVVVNFCYSELNENKIHEGGDKRMADRNMADTCTEEGEHSC